MKASVSNNTVLTISVAKEKYVTGDTVLISGSAGLKEEPIFLQVFNPKDAAYRFDLIPSSSIRSDGTYNYSLKVGGKLGIDGVYRVIATQLDQNATTTFLLAELEAQN